MNMHINTSGAELHTYADFTGLNFSPILYLTLFNLRCGTCVGTLREIESSEVITTPKPQTLLTSIRISAK